MKRKSPKAPSDKITVSVSKNQAAGGAAGAVVGAIVAGPVGAIVGGVIGTMVAGNTKEIKKAVAPTLKKAAKSAVAATKKESAKVAKSVRTATKKLPLVSSKKPVAPKAARPTPKAPAQKGKKKGK